MLNERGKCVKIVQGLRRIIKIIRNILNVYNAADKRLLLLLCSNKRFHICFLFFFIRLLHIKIIYYDKLLLHDRTEILKSK